MTWTPCNTPIPSYGGYGDLAARRKNATRESTATLKAWLNEHKKNPYPTKGEKIMLAIITKMTLTQVGSSLFCREALSEGSEALTINPFDPLVKTFWDSWRTSLGPNHLSSSERECHSFIRFAFLIDFWQLNGILQWLALMMKIVSQFTKLCLMTRTPDWWWCSRSAPGSPTPGGGWRRRTRWRGNLKTSLMTRMWTYLMTKIRIIHSAGMRNQVNKHQLSPVKSVSNTKYRINCKSSYFTIPVSFPSLACPYNCRLDCWLPPSSHLTPGSDLPRPELELFPDKSSQVNSSHRYLLFRRGGRPQAGAGPPRPGPPTGGEGREQGGDPHPSQQAKDLVHGWDGGVQDSATQQSALELPRAPPGQRPQVRHVRDGGKTRRVPALSALHWLKATSLHQPVQPRGLLLQRGAQDRDAAPHPAQRGEDDGVQQCDKYAKQWPNPVLQSLRLPVQLPAAVRGGQELCGIQQW